MKKFLLRFIFAIAVVHLSAGLIWGSTIRGEFTVSVYFSPNGGCTRAINNEIRKAQKSILVQAYSFTSAPIAAELLRAHKRGVKIQAILDKSNDSNKYSAAKFLDNAGIETWIDGEHAIAHNKVMIIDGTTVITGSFNFTRQAEERNAENLLIIKNKKLASLYADNWNTHLKHSVRYRRLNGARVLFHYLSRSLAKIRREVYPLSDIKV